MYPKFKSLVTGNKSNLQPALGEIKTALNAKAHALVGEIQKHMFTLKEVK